MVGVVGVPVALGIAGSSSTAGKGLVELFAAVEDSVVGETREANHDDLTCSH